MLWANSDAMAFAARQQVTLLLLARLLIELQTVNLLRFGTQHENHLE
jgi:hypothetical protein